MKFVITQGNVKRELCGSFSLCASRYDLERLKSQIEIALLADEKFTYGGIEIHEPLPRGVVNEPPQPWGKQ